ncbi:EAL domain-containing protein [Marinobacterium sp. BA1]|uniref:bifunctional diguanylate cyclase/phosphodiesterase n=1 Tax=Marinobacterium sp. BA1 TaxID=3138931 RepID=UPI0032E7CF56
MPLTIDSKTLPRYQTRAFIGTVLVLMLLVSAFFVMTAWQNGHERLRQQRLSLQQSSQEKLRQEVDATLDYINFTRQQTEAVLRDNIQAQVRQAMQLAQSIYDMEIQLHGDGAKEQVGELIREALRDLRFFDGRGYIFIDTLEGECILLPISPDIEGKSLLDNQDDTGHYIMRGLIEAVQNPNQAGFSRYRWYAPDYPDEMREKIAYVELFEPLDWIIGTGDYLYQVENDLKQQALNRLEALTFGDEGYIAVLHKNGQVLLSPTRPGSSGKLVSQLDSEHRKMVNWLLEQATPEGRFVEYDWYKPGAEGIHHKLSLVQDVPERDWVLIAGIYQESMDEVLAMQKAKLEQELQNDLQWLILVLLFAMAAAILVAWIISRWLRTLMRRYQQEIDQRQVELERTADELKLSAQVFESASEGAMISDADNRIMAVNPAFTRITGYPEADVVGKTPALLASGRHSSAFFERMWQTLQEQGRWQGEVWNRRRSGEIYPQWLSISLVRDEAGAVRNHVAMLTDMTERKEAEDQLRYLSDFDPLTDLPNRRLLRDRTIQAIARARRRHEQAALLIIDLDRFKNINDSLGHGSGDTVLKIIASRLSEQARDSDTISRLGGDEFVILLPDLGEQADLSGLASRYLQLIAEPLQVEDHTMVTTASIGLALYPGDGEDFDTLFKNADTALYHAKGQGRNNFQFFTEAMNQQVSERLLMETRLRDALGRDELELYYQPQYDVSSNCLTGCEALLRWNSSQGLVMPDRFIPLAEETGLIIPIGAWVLQQACNQAREWDRIHGKPLSMAVNVSAVQFRPELVDEVKAALSESGFPADQLVLEVTESVLMSDVEGSVSLLHQLRELGVRIALDDFGTGYASLAYLKRFALDKLKIDRTFIMGIPDDEDDVAITSSIIDIARHLRLKTVAEGVETEAHCEFLRRAGCHIAQGYFYARPLPASEFELKLK